MTIIFILCDSKILRLGIRQFLFEHITNVEIYSIQHISELGNYPLEAKKIILLSDHPVKKIQIPAGSELLLSIGLQFREIDQALVESSDVNIHWKQEEQLLTAIREQLSQEEQKDSHELSEREKEIVKEVALGLTNKEIAEKLYLSAHTVITHRKNITRKLGIKTVSGLTVYAILNQLIDLGEVQ